MRKIEKLQAETDNKQTNLEQLRREMVELENTLEQEQEALVRINGCPRYLSPQVTARRNLGCF